MTETPDPTLALVDEMMGRILEPRIALWTLWAVDRGLPDAMDPGGNDPEELARRLGLHGGSLASLLAVLATRGLVHRLPGGDYALTPLGTLLRRDHPCSQRAPWLLQRSFLEVWAAVGITLETGHSAFPAVHGTSLFEALAEDPGTGALFDASMTALGHRFDEAIARAACWPARGVVADIGGGHGHLLQTVLDRHPGLEGILVDRPGVLRGRETLPAHAASGNSIRCVAGDFFQPLGLVADVFVLKLVLHDWGRDDAIAIVKNVGAAMREGDRLLVAELGMSGDAAIRPGHPGPVFDLTMRLLFEGGCERTLADYAGIAQAAGLEPAGCTDTGTGIVLMEFRRPRATPG